MISEINNNIKKRMPKEQMDLFNNPIDNPINDEFYTPLDLAKICILYIPVSKGDTWLESAYGTGNFYNNFPDEINKEYSNDFFKVIKRYDWIITNPPYSKLDNWFLHTCRLSIKGFGLLININNLTVSRIKLCNDYGFGMTRMFMFKVKEWFGMSVFVVFEKGKGNIIDISDKKY